MHQFISLAGRMHAHAAAASRRCCTNGKPPRIRTNALYMGPIDPGQLPLCTLPPDDSTAYTMKRK